MNKKTKETELTFDQVDTECNHFSHKSSQIGISVYSIIIKKWDEYQSEYLRQKPYRHTKSSDGIKLQNKAPKSITQVTYRGEERRLEEKREEERRSESPPNSNSSNSPLPSPPKENKTIKEEFLDLLQSCIGYPFDESRDSLLFDISIKENPEISILKQTQKKIHWWKDNPGAFKADPRKQLQEWFKEESEFKSRGGASKDR